mmetsp:Transcript_8251/g.26130  ORF Transcript_8251/g.26130 Transcript_8251/m.26130 type:complete len:386 (-) Transcript_8251:263-1420(-)
MDSIARGSNNDNNPRLQHGAAPPIKPSPPPPPPPSGHIFGSVAIIFSVKNGRGGAAGFEGTLRAFLGRLGGDGEVLSGVAALRNELQDVELLQGWKLAGVTFSDFVKSLGYLPVMFAADDEPGWVRTGIAPNVCSAPAYKTHKDSSVGRFFSPMLRSLLLLKVGTLRVHLYPIAYPAAAAVPPAAAASSSSSPLPPATEPTDVVTNIVLAGMQLHSDGNTGDQAAKIKVSVTVSGVYVKVAGLDNLAAARAEAAGQPREAVMGKLSVPPQLRSAVSQRAGIRRGGKGNQNTRVASAASPEGVLPKDEKAATELSGITGYSVSKETRMHYTEVLQKRDNTFGYYRVSFIDAHTGEEVTILDLCDKRVTGKKKKRLGKRTVNVLHGL